jgi:hypothetical protein
MTKGFVRIPIFVCEKLLPNYWYGVTNLLSLVSPMTLDHSNFLEKDANGRLP